MQQGNGKNGGSSMLHDTSSLSYHFTEPRPAKSWLARSLGTIMQLPKSTPLSVLQWTTPEGPMPRIVHMPSRDQGRTIEVYVWVPPSTAVLDPVDSSQVNSAPTSKQTGKATPHLPQPIRPAFTGPLRPCLVDFHGGGFIMGGPLEQAPWCAALARSGIIAISVAYRLGPTWEFPAALHDAEDVVRAVVEGQEGNDVAAGLSLREMIDEEAGGPGKIYIDKGKVALSGFSSGGNVALNMLLHLPQEVLASQDSLSAKDWPSPFPIFHPAPIPALLFFPSLDARQAPYERNRPASMTPAGGLSKFIGRTLKNAYLPADKVGHLRASPGLAPTSSIHESTRALLILPEMDSLSEQSETWVQKLDSVGILEQAGEETGDSIDEPLHQERSAVRVHRIKGMSHGFTTYPDSFIDEATRKSKQLVMEKARRWIIGMFGGDAGDKEESKHRVEAITQGLLPDQGVRMTTAKLAKTIE